MIPVTLEAIEREVPVRTVIAEWDARLGRRLMAAIMDNRFDFRGEASAYILTHKRIFLESHAKGMLRVLFGTGREHLLQAFLHGKPPPPPVMRAYDIALITYTLAFYTVALFFFRGRSLRKPAVLFSVAFILYTLALIGVQAYTTGGALKRSPFLPFVVIVAAMGSRSATNPSVSAPLTVQRKAGPIASTPRSAATA
jgi:hypothetical protein